MYRLSVLFKIRGTADFDHAIEAFSNDFLWQVSAIEYVWLSRHLVLKEYHQNSLSIPMVKNSFRTC